MLVGSRGGDQTGYVETGFIFPARRALELLTHHYCQCRLIDELNEARTCISSDPVQALCISGAVGADDTKPDPVWDGFDDRDNWPRR
jgi:hypothetical protein